MYARPCSAGAQWIPRVVDRTDRRATTFTMSLSRQPPVKCTLNSCGTAHLVMLCDCSTALCKEKIGTDKDLLHVDPVHNASHLFSKIYATLCLQVASECTPLSQHRPRLKVVLRGPLDGTTPSLNEHTGAVIQTSQIQLSKHSNQSNLQP